MTKDRAAKNNNKSTTPSTTKQLQEKTRALEAQINYTKPSVEDITYVMAIDGVPEHGKTPVPKSNITSLSEKADKLKADDLDIQGILKRKRERLDPSSSSEGRIDLQ